MITEDWKPRYNDGQNGDGQNRERRPYNLNRSNYGNQGTSYGRTDNRSSYNRPTGTGGYDRRDDGGYRPKPSYNREGDYNSRSNTGNYDRSGSYNRSNSYNRPNDGGDRPQRSYDNSSDYQNGGEKKRRLRVGEIATPARSSNYGDRPYQPRSQGDRYQQRPQGGGYNNYQRNNDRDGGGYNPNAKYGLQKQLKYREEHFDPNEPIRLNKYLANAGVCSRREADEFIKAGLVKVNGEVVAEVGTKVKRADLIMFHDEPIKLEHKIYLLLNKPRNCVTTADDPQERLTVMDLVKTACQERIFPVGRLDRNTTGVLLLTNDGDLSSKLTHPKFLKKKIYHVWLDKNVAEEDMQKLADGIDLEDGEIHADAISYVNDEEKDQVGIEIHSGKNRIVRRMFERLGYHVMKLDRVYFAGLTKKNLKKGHWRFLSEQEVNMLRMGSFE
ncbi:Ribosomal large subunit pseudouridine synthase B [termite gut metagenome]|uniref:Ribosomal large subunit pseudouridine synthase B n=1 Tax=termite gut metagenome TaxID=433724 RepID=A0A5J4SS55_9ZZZZ